ncbi:MAG: class I SAM-dependent methyltransferase [Myxococcota bacterium]
MSRAWDPRLYDALVAARVEPPWEVDVYLALSRLARGPVLELGAGTGRILMTLLSHGVDAYGLELDPEMAREGQRRLRAAGCGDASERLRVGDMTEFVDPRRYRLVFIPYNTLALVDSPEGLRSALRCVHRALDPEGELAFDLFLPDPLRSNDVGERTLDVSGRAVRYREESRYDPESRIHILEQRFFGDGIDQTLVVRMYHWPRKTLERHLEEAGFSFIVPPLDERGAPVSDHSRVYIARLRRK